MVPRDRHLLPRSAKRIAQLVCRGVCRARPVTSEDARAIWEQAASCCVVAGAGIGDALMATPLLRAIKERKPGIRTFVLCSRRISSILATNPNVDELMTFGFDGGALRTACDRPNWRTVARLRQQRLDLWFCAQPFNNVMQSLVSAICRARLRLKHASDYRATPERDFSFVYHQLLPDDSGRHRVELNLDLLRFCGEDIPETSIRPEYTIQQTARRTVQTRLEKCGIAPRNGCIFAVHAGAGRADKRWPASRFAELVQHLLQQGHRVVLIGGAEERALNESIEQTAASDRLVNLAGLLRLSETAALLGECTCLVANDSGMMHLAAAVRTPVVGLFGRTDPGRIGPCSANSAVVRAAPDISGIKLVDALRAIDRLLCNQHVAVSGE